MLQRAIRLSVITWEGELESMTSGILRGITRLICVFGDELKDEAFKEKVGRCTAREISRTARERKAGSIGYAEAMLILYNRKNGSNAALKWASLYDKNHRPSETSEQISMN